MTAQRAIDLGADAAALPTPTPTWCPGCGNFGVLAALEQAIEVLGLAPHEVVVVAGIGCGSKLPDYLATYGLLSIHGRPLPIATGIKLANPKLHVIVVDGDGDAYSIGGNHLVHTARRNPDITHIVQNNQVYGLTGGQRSPTGPAGSEAWPCTTPDEPDAVVPTQLTFSAGAGFVARGLSNRVHDLAELIVQGVRFPGYAHIDVMQPCVTFGGNNDFERYRGRTYDVPPTHEVHDRSRAATLVEEWGERIPLGVLYQAAEPRRVAGGPRIEGGASPVEQMRAHDPRRPEYRALLDRLR